MVLSSPGWISFSSVGPAVVDVAADDRGPLSRSHLARAPVMSERVSEPVTVRSRVAHGDQELAPMW
ncbi:hypothetical protein SFUMM280S_11503 [Streptomyces fumanus]